MQLLVYASTLPGWANRYLFVTSDFSKGRTDATFPSTIQNVGILWSSFIRDRRLDYLFTCSSQADFEHQLLSKFPELLL